MIITKQWIHDHKTPAGGWNRKQMTAIGVSWPQPRGWINDVVGMDICTSSQLRFEFQSGSYKQKESLEDRIRELEKRLCQLENIILPPV